MDRRSDPEHMPLKPTALLVFLFLGSGAAALIYELAWFHVLRLVVGSSSISVAALLVSFMGGMGIGSVLLPRLVPPTWHPLRVYAGRGNDLQPWLSDAPINHDRSLRLQYLAGLALDQQNAYAIYGAIIGYRRYPTDLFDVAPQDEAMLLRRY